MLRSWTLSLFFGLVPGVGHAQERATQPPVFRATGGLVLVDFVVTDKGGSLVAGLSANDFVVKEDGKERPIISFQAFGSGQILDPSTSPVTLPESSPLPPPAMPEAVTVLLVDDCRVSPMQAERLNPALKAALKKMGESRGGLALVAPGAGVFEARTLPEGVMDLVAAVDRITTFPKPKCNTDARKDTDGVYDLMTQSMNWLADKPGRHSLVLVSPGFGHPRVDLARNEVVKMSLRANAPIHFMDIRGNEGLSGYRDVGGAAGFGGVARQPGVLEWSIAAEGASSLADDTGGLTIRNGNDLLGGLERVFDTMKTYYLVGYQPPEHKKPGFRKVSVEARTKGLKVVARAGYFDEVP